MISQIRIKFKPNIYKKKNTHNVAPEGYMNHSLTVDIPTITVNESSNQKTKKKKKPLSMNEKTKLWEIFDNENENPVKKHNHKAPLECIYEQKIENDLCNICHSILMLMDDGFPTCTNTSCGVIYKNTLDYSP